MSDSPKNGQSGCHGQSFGTIPLFTLPPTPLHFRFFMVGILLLLVYYGNQRTFMGSVEEYLEERDVILKELKGFLMRAKQLMKAKADKHRKDEEFVVGD